MNDAQRLGNEIIDWSKVVIIAMICIVLVYQVAQSLWGTVPATVGSVLFGLAGVFIVTTNEKVRSKIKDWRIK